MTRFNRWWHINDDEVDGEVDDNDDNDDDDFGDNDIDDFQVIHWWVTRGWNVARVSGVQVCPRAQA